MEILNGIKNLLEIIDEAWTTIVVIIGVAIGIYEGIRNYLNKSKEEKVEIAKTQISEIILKIVSDAEEEYDEWNQAGSLKRSEVIEKIYSAFPILSRVVDQDALIDWIDEQIDSALGNLKGVIENNSESEISNDAQG